jgi:drug/metabolite transporter (DMT)-like permease
MDEGITPRTVGLAGAALAAFAANSLLCRLALERTAIDAVSFTTIRIVSGAATLALLLLLQRRPARFGGDWPAALALYGYAIAFSLAYLALGAGTGALLLFGAVQLTMFAVALGRGERLDAVQSTGLALAAAGVGGLLWPGLSAPPLGSAALMLAAGVAWGAYSLRGRGSADPLADTAGNFLRGAPVAFGVSLAFLGSMRLDPAGAAYAVASGALASGLGYAVWYAALRGLTATRAATVQLAVPVLAALGGVALLDERLTPRLVIASLAVLGGIALVIVRRGRAVAPARMGNRL